MRSVADMLGTLEPADKAKAEALQEKYQQEAERYDKERAATCGGSEEARSGAGGGRRREDRYDAGEVILEIALIICSLTLLTKKRVFCISGIAIGLVGFVVTLSGFRLQ
jgi:Domain of unknown function (DUF4337)